MIVKLDDSPEMINGLDGVICTGTFTKKMVEAIEIWECPVIFIDADPNPKRFLSGRVWTYENRDDRLSRS